MKRADGGGSGGIRTPGGTIGIVEAVQKLRKHHGRPEKPPTTDAFELILLENVAYLASPERRREAFEQLRKTAGTKPAAVLTASPRAIESVTARGILGSRFAGKLRECARIAVESFDGDLDAVLEGPLPAAKKALQRFPGIGEPGAEKILLFSGRHAMLAPESNGLRVLVRLGLVVEGKSYASTYAAARDTARELQGRVQAAEDLTAAIHALQEAHLLLQEHGRTLCRRSTPLCEVCPLAGGCAYARTAAGAANGSVSRRPVSKRRQRLDAPPTRRSSRDTEPHDGPRSRGKLRPRAR